MLNNNILLDFISGSVVLILSSLGMFIVKSNNLDAMGYHYGPDFFPSLVLWLMISLSAILSIKSLYLLYSQRKKGLKNPAITFNKNLVLKVLAFIALTISYAFAFVNIGFFVSTTILLFFVQILYGNRNLLKISIMSIALPIILYFVFNGLFKIPLTTIFD